MIAKRTWTSIYNLNLVILSCYSYYDDYCYFYFTLLWCLRLLASNGVNLLATKLIVFFLSLFLSLSISYFLTDVRLFFLSSIHSLLLLLLYFFITTSCSNWFSFTLDWMMMMMIFFYLCIVYHFITFRSVVVFYNWIVGGCDTVNEIYTISYFSVVVVVVDSVVLLTL